MLDYVEGVVDYLDPWAEFLEHGTELGVHIHRDAHDTLHDIRPHPSDEVLRLRLCAALLEEDHMSGAQIDHDCGVPVALVETELVYADEGGSPFGFHATVDGFEPLLVQHPDDVLVCAHHVRDVGDCGTIPLQGVRYVLEEQPCHVVAFRLEGDRIASDPAADRTSVDLAVHLDVYPCEAQPQMLQRTASGVADMHGTSASTADRRFLDEVPYNRLDHEAPAVVRGLDPVRKVSLHP